MKKNLFIIILGAALLCACSKDNPIIEEIGPAEPAVKVDPVAVLKELYVATDGDHWTQPVNWKEVDNLRDMDEVQLKDGMLVVDLSKHGLKGTLPESLLLLMEDYDLEINLSENELEGELPEYKGKETCFYSSLNLCRNNFSGKIPESWAKCRRLTINVKYNKLKGALPQSLKSLLYYSYWEMYPQQQGYQVTEEAMAEPSENDCAVLLEICRSFPDYVRENLGWEDEENTGVWERITWDGKGRCAYINLEGCGIELIPSVINRLDALQYLNLKENGLRTLPDMSSMQDLQTLIASENQFEEIPATIFDLGNLHHLDLSKNPITTEVPEALNLLTKLKGLFFQDVPFRGKIPVLDKLTNLRSINFDGCKKFDVQNFPEWLTRCPELKEILLDGCNLEGEIPESIRNLSHLTLFNVWDNMMSGNVEHLFEEMDELESLVLTANLFTGNLPLFSEKARIKSINLFDNVFSGVIPDNYSHQHYLEVLYLSDNRLTGNIPAFLVDIPTLMDLNLNKNYLSGELPIEVIDCMVSRGWIFKNQNGAGFSNLGNI